MQALTAYPAQADVAFVATSVLSHMVDAGVEVGSVEAATTMSTCVSALQRHAARADIASNVLSILLNLGMRVGNRHFLATAAVPAIVGSMATHASDARVAAKAVKLLFTVAQSPVLAEVLDPSVAVAVGHALAAHGLKHPRVAEPALLCLGFLGKHPGQRPGLCPYVPTVAAVARAHARSAAIVDAAMFLLSRLALDGSAPPLACRPTLVAEVGLVLDVCTPHVGEGRVVRNAMQFLVGLLGEGSGVVDWRALRGWVLAAAGAHEDDDAMAKEAIKLIVAIDRLSQRDGRSGRGV